MRKVALFSLLLVIGLVLSQVLPVSLGEHFGPVAFAIKLLTMVGLGFIMIHVGYEFEIDKKNPGQYTKDYVIAATAAAFPWILCAVYFVFAMVSREGWSSWDLWKEVLLASRFASPTSAGVLFSMLAAAGLSATWLYRRARIIAIFDDLDTVLFMIPLQIAMVGFRWQLTVIVVVVTLLLWVAWRYLHEVSLPVTWRWVLTYAVVLTAITEGVLEGSLLIDSSFPIHIEILLPAFALGCILRRPPGTDPHSDDAVEGHQEGPESPEEQQVSTIVAGCFMCLVGMSMPLFMGEQAGAGAGGHGNAPPGGDILARLTPEIGWGMVVAHVAAITVLSNIGKMFASFCYRNEASWRERVALGVGLWPRGEVGGGVIVLSLSYGIGGPVMLVAMLSLAVNLLLTGAFIMLIKWLIATPADVEAETVGV